MHGSAMMYVILISPSSAPPLSSGVEAGAQPYVATRRSFSRQSTLGLAVLAVVEGARGG
jgi:hypothetical protein